MRLIMLFLILALCACNNTSKDVLDMMEVVFKGNYTRQEIKTTLDRAMTLYGVPINEDNYNHYGDILLNLRKNTSVKEMDILNSMINSYITTSKIDFGEAAKRAAYAGKKGTLMWPRDIGEDKWPIITRYVRIYCKNLGYGAKAVYLTTSTNETDIYDYAVNGTARGKKEQLGLREIEPLIKKDMLPMHLSPFIEIGLKECVKQL